MLCVYLSNEKIKLIDGVYRGGKLFIKGVFSAISPNEFLDNDFSEATATNQIMEVIASGIREITPKGKKMILVLDNSKIPFSEMKLPHIKPIKLLPLIKNEIFTDEKLSNSNTVDYVETERNIDPEKRSRMFVSYLSNDLLDELQDISKNLGYKLQVIDIAQNSLSKLMRLMNKIMPDNYMLMDYKETSVTLYLISKGRHLFSLSKPIIAVPSLKFQNERYYFINEMSGVLNNTVQFFKKRFVDVAFNAIYVTGEVEKFSVCAKAISDQIGFNVIVLQRPDNITGIEDSEFNLYANALGGLIRQR